MQLLTSACACSDSKANCRRFFHAARLDLGSSGCTVFCAECEWQWQLGPCADKRSFAEVLQEDLFKKSIFAICGLFLWIQTAKKSLFLTTHMCLTSASKHHARQWHVWRPIALAIFSFRLHLQFFSLFQRSSCNLMLLCSVCLLTLRRFDFTNYVE